MISESRLWSIEVQKCWGALSPFNFLQLDSEEFTSLLSDSWNLQELCLFV